MSEIDSPPENPKIPGDWKFPERGDPGLKVTQIDLGERFLAFTLPDGSDNKSVDYFFGSEGDITGYRVIPVIGSISVGLTSDNKLTYDVLRIVSSLQAPELNGMSIYLKQAKSNLLLDLIEDRLGGFMYGGRELLGLELDSIFLEETEQQTGIESPRCTLSFTIPTDKGQEGGKLVFEVIQPREYDAYRREYIAGDFVLVKEAEKKIHVFDKNRKKVFEIEPSIEEAGTHEVGSEVLVFKQTHTPSGIIKTLKGPLRVDLQKVEETINVRAPYDKEKVGGKDRLVVPWTNIHRIVGAGLSYSYPPPNPKSS